MLKLNTTGGKIDITLSDDVIYGSSQKATIKPHLKKAVATKAAQPQGKQPNKSVHAPASKGRESRQPKPLRKELVKQGKVPPNKQGKKPPRPGSKTVVKSDSKSHDAGMITQTRLENILSLLSNEGTSPVTSLSPEQLSVLITSLGKTRLPESEALQEKQSKNERVTQMNGGNYDTRNVKLPVTDHKGDDNKSQWKRELDEQTVNKNKATEQARHKSTAGVEEYNPWGRPGAGAPIRSQSGKVLADYHQRAQHQEQTPRAENVPVLSVPQTVSNYSAAQQPRPTPIATTGSSTSNIDTTLPVALRSSFAVGAPGLVSHDTQQKRLQELRWKQELVKQIEEKKESEKQRKFMEEQEDLLNMSWNNRHINKQHTTQQTTQHISQQTPQHTSQHTSQHTLPGHTNDISAAQQRTASPLNTHTQGTQDATSPLLNSSLNGSLKTHARGYGMHSMDPQTKDETEKKRLKMLEHQQAIQEQVEEKRRKKQQERELRLREEAVEEARLAKERETLNQIFAFEQKKKRQKEEEAKRLSEALQQSVLDAYEAAQKVKIEKRRKHVGAAGHDTRRAPSRSYVVSHGPSVAQHIIPDNVPGMTIDTRAYDKHSASSYYASPRLPDRETTNRGRGRTSQTSEISTSLSHGSYPRSFVPPLNLARAASPPVPTLRNKVANPAKSQRRVKTPGSTRSNLHRTVSSYSEPCDGSMALSSLKEDLVMLQAGNTGIPQEESFPSFPIMEDAFTIPFHRTDSATLPAPPDSPDENQDKQDREQPSNNQQPIRIEAPGDGKRVQTVFRTKAEKSVSPIRVKGNKTSQARQKQQLTKLTPSPRLVYQRSTKDSIESKAHKKPSDTQLRDRQEMERKRGTKDQISPRKNANSVRSVHHELPDPLPTARQEMILQQLAALRRGLIIKEQELKQGALRS